ncbi:hypothetical protein ES703_100403 [subsurface metagenome]
MYAGYNKARNVCYVADVVCAYIFGYLAEDFKVNFPRICCGAGDDDFGFVLFCELFNLVIVQSAGIRADCILDGLKYFARDADFPAVCEVSTVWKRQAHNGIARFCQSQISGPICY